MNKGYFFYIILFFTFYNIFSIIDLKNTKNISNTQIEITGNFMVLQNSSFQNQVEFNGSLNINPKLFQASLNLNGEIFFANNSIIIGNIFNNTLLKIDNLQTGQGIYNLTIDLNTNNILFYPINESYNVKNSNDYSVNTLNTNILKTILIQSEMISNGENVIIMGNNENFLTLQGENLLLNSYNGIQTNQNAIIINAFFNANLITLPNDQNVINIMQANDNIEIINNCNFISQNNQDLFSINNSFVTQFNNQNTINIVGEKILFDNNTGTLPIIIGAEKNDQTIILNNIPINQNNKIFLVLDENNILSKTILQPKLDVLITNEIINNILTTITIKNLIQIGNNIGTLTINSPTIYFSKNITQNNQNSNKKYLLEKNNYLKSNILLNNEIVDLIKIIIKKYNILKENNVIKNKLIFFMKELFL